MSRAKIAPVLVYAHKPTPIRKVMQGKGAIRSYSAAKAWAELRALLAVARAAQGLVDVEGRDGPEAERLVKSLSRLSRASGRSSSAPRGKP